MVKCVIAALVLSAAAAMSALGGEVLLLDFTSPHCGPCRQMVPTINSMEAAGYKIRRVDTTVEPQLAQQYGVTNIPCFVMLANGQEVDRVVGATSPQRLTEIYKRAVEFVSVRSQSPDPAANQVIGQAAAAHPQAGVVDPWSSATAPAGPPASQSTFGTSDAASMRTVTKAAPIGTREPLTDSFAMELISSSVRLRVDDPGGHSYGTGTIIDTRSGEALVITCGHLFRDSKGQGPIMVEIFAATADGVRVVEQVPATLVDYNLDRDIGLVSIKATNNLRVAPVASTETLVDRGDRVTSVGCDHGKDPTALASRVTNVDRYQGPPNIEISGAPVEGRSGGGLFNDNGQLVGVCFAADYEGNEGLYTALASIHDELDRLGLADVYRRTGAATTAQGPAATTPLTAQPSAPQPPATIIRGQEPQPQPMQVADMSAFPTSTFPATTNAAAATAPVTPVGAATASAPANAGLQPMEQAALDEILSRRVDAEVVCIIRPKEPGGKSEVITLDRVSPAFVEALAQQVDVVSGSVTR
jgi:thiol-disulfide isomerase/thioredoxin